MNGILELRNKLTEDLLTAVKNAVIQKRRKQAEADQMHQNTQPLLHRLREKPLHRGYGNVSAPAVNTGCAEKSRPDQQEAGNLL